VPRGAKRSLYIEQASASQREGATPRYAAAARRTENKNRAVPIDQASYGAKP
tara:strand:- start:614 stop:769 length:156 start_codon:yes stop_codon:yes gene_type:complete